MNSNDIDDLLKFAVLRENKIPEKVDKRIEETLRIPKKMKSNIIIALGRLIAIITSVLTIAAGGVGVYAAMGGEVAGKPVFEFLGIKVSSKIDKYRENVEDQVIYYEDTKIELVSSICSEGITILEFDVKLSKEDKEKLLLGKSIIRQEDYDMFEETKINIREGAEETLKQVKQHEIVTNTGKYVALEDIEVDAEELENLYQERLKSYEDIMDYKEETKYTLGLALNTEQVIGKYTPDKWNPDSDLYGTIYIDNQGYYAKNWQKSEKVNDYEYKIYQMYLLTDTELQGKEDFKITLKNNKLVNMTLPYTRDGEEWNWTNDSEWFAKSFDDEYYEEQRKIIINLDGDFEAQVSKEKVLEDSKIIENLDLKSEFRNITISVEKVTVTPIQTIIQIKHTATQQTTPTYKQKSEKTDEIEYLPMTSKFRIYDEDGNEINNIVLSNWRTLIYEDGTTRTYDSHDIPQEKIKNATWETVEYIVIENTQCSKLTIITEEITNNFSDGENIVEMDSIEIDLR